MPNCDFYALREDAVEILRYIFAQPIWRLYELASRPDSELRCFATVREVEEAFDLASESTFLVLHSPEMGGAVHCRRAALDAGRPVSPVACGSA